jgi:hypothetical protein
MITLTPYLTDYKSAPDAISAWRAGHDFTLNDVRSPWHGKPCSIRDFPDQQIRIRYASLRRVTVARP